MSLLDDLRKKAQQTVTKISTLGKQVAKTVETATQKPQTLLSTLRKEDKKVSAPMTPAPIQTKIPMTVAPKKAAVPVLTSDQILEREKKKAKESGLRITGGTKANPKVAETVEAIKQIPVAIAKGFQTYGRNVGNAFVAPAIVNEVGNVQQRNDMIIADANLKKIKEQKKLEKERKEKTLTKQKEKNYIKKIAVYDDLIDFTTQQQARSVGDITGGYENTTAEAVRNQIGATGTVVGTLGMLGGPLPATVAGTFQAGTNAVQEGAGVSEVVKRTIAAAPFAAVASKVPGSGVLSRVGTQAGLNIGQAVTDQALSSRQPKGFGDFTKTALVSGITSGVLGAVGEGVRAGVPAFKEGVTAAAKDQRGFARLPGTASDDDVLFNNLAKAVRNSSLYKKEGTVSDALGEGSLYVKNGDYQIAFGDDKQKLIQSGYRMLDHVDTMATNLGFDSGHSLLEHAVYSNKKGTLGNQKKAEDAYIEAEYQKFLDEQAGKVEKPTDVATPVESTPPFPDLFGETPTSPTVRAQKPPLPATQKSGTLPPDYSVQSDRSYTPTLTQVRKNAIDQTAKVVKEKPATVRKITEKIDNLKTNVVEYVQNSQERVRQLVNRKDVAISDESDPYLKMVLYHGRVGSKMDDLQAKTKEIMSEMQTVAKEVKSDITDIRKDVSDYLLYRHAPERNAAIGPKAAGVSTEEANVKLAALEASPRGARIKEMADKVQEINKQTIEILHDSGVITTDLYNTLRAKYKSHVPLNRIMDNTEDVGSILTGTGFNVRSTGIKRAKGSEKVVDDVFGNVITNYEQAVLRAEKNIVDQATLQFVRNNKDILGDSMFETKLPIMPVGKVKMKSAVDPVFMEKMNDFVRSLEGTVERQGQPSRRLGAYYPSEQKVTTKFATPREVLSHEVGHFLDDKFRLKQKFYNRGQSKLVAAEMRGHMVEMGETNARINNPSERFATAFEWWLTHRDLAKDDLPLFSKQMEDIIAGIPELKPILTIKPSSRVSLETMEQVIMARQQFTTDPRILTLREKGKPVYIKFKDPRVAVAFQGVGKEKLPLLLKAVGSFTRLYSGLATRFNPDFFGPNKVRDLQETAVYLASQKDIGFKGAAKTVVRDPASMKDIFDFYRGNDTPGAKLYREMVETGGTTGGFGLSSRKQTDVNLDKLEKIVSSPTHKIGNTIIEGIDKWNTLFEDSTRLSVYKTALDRGLSKERAAFLAKEASINFNTMGKGGPVINALYMFSNASLQGSTKMLRSLKNPKVLGATVLAVVSSVSAVNQWNDQVDKDWREKVSKWDRLNGLTVAYPSGDGNFRYFTIPVSWGIKPMKVMADYAYDATTGDDSFTVDNMMKDTITSLIEAYNPTGGTDIVSALVPTVLDIPVEIARNRSWSGNKIRPDYDSNAPADIQYFSSLDKTAVGRGAISLSKLLQNHIGVAISPADIKYAFEGYTGGAGRFATKTGNVIVGATESAITGKNKLPPLDEFPLISRFYRSRTAEEIGKLGTGDKKLDKALETQSRENFYKKQRIDTVYDEISDLPPGQQRKDAVAKLIRENPEEAKKLAEKIKKEALGRTFEDTKVSQLQVENGARAAYIFDNLSDETPENKKAVISDLIQKKIITEEVAMQIVEMIKQQQ